MMHALLQYELALYFDADGDTNAVYLLERTFRTNDMQVCIQYMKFDEYQVNHLGNVMGNVYGVPYITNPMIYDQLDCTLGQGPKNGASLATTTMALLVSAVMGEVF